MKKLGEEMASYAALLVLLAATFILGRNGSYSMVMNYVFLAGMAVLVFVTDRCGLKRIGMMADDLRSIADKIRGDMTDQEFMHMMQVWHQNPNPEAIAEFNRKNLGLMNDLGFRQPSADQDWHRLLKDWKASDGMDCDVEDYLFEDEMLEYCNYNICMQIPGILTALGILGTFLGLVIGLHSFDFSNADQMTSSVEALVGGLNVAFYTSIYGVTLSIVYNFVLRRRVTEIGQALNRFYDIFHASLKPLSHKGVAEKISQNQDDQKVLLQDMKELMDERFGERLAGQMAETLTPVFERINQSLDHMMLDFHKEQADSLEKIVDAFVLQMSGALNDHVNVLGESVDQLSRTQQDMSAELQQLIRQIAQTGTDTARINEQAGEILKQLNGYVPQLEKTARDSAEIIAQMGHWAESIQNMSVTQSAILQTLALHEGNLDKTCAKINANQEVLNSKLADFTEAAKVLAEREKDPMQFDDLKDMLTAYMTAMQNMQNTNAERMENLWKQMASEEKKQQGDVYQSILGQLQEMQRAQQDILKAQQDMVYLNGRIAGILSGQSRDQKIQLPSGKAASEEEQWMKHMNEKMDAWMERQEAFQRQLLEMERSRNRSVWSRIRGFFSGTDR